MQNTALTEHDISLIEKASKHLSGKFLSRLRMPRRPIKARLNLIIDMFIKPFFPHDLSLIYIGIFVLNLRKFKSIVFEIKNHIYILLTLRLRLTTNCRFENGQMVSPHLTYKSKYLDRCIKKLHKRLCQIIAV